MENSTLPHVSIIIPCYNDETGIQDTLNSLTFQNYPKDLWEVIVVDNNSTDNTAEVARSFQSRIPKLQIIFERSRQSSYAARNRGIEAANGEILVFIDADMTVQRDWLKRGVLHIVQKRGDYIGCRIEMVTRYNPPTIWELLDQKTGFDVQAYIQRGFTVTASLFVRRSVINEVGMFDERLISGGDREFGNRVKEHGFTLYYDDENVIYHPTRASLKAFWKKSTRLAWGEEDLRYLYPQRYGSALSLWSILSQCHPHVNVWWFLPTSNPIRQQSLRSLVEDLDYLQRLKMLFVTNIVHFARFYGFFKHYVSRTFRQKFRRT